MPKYKISEYDKAWAILMGAPFKCVYINDSGGVVDTASAWKGYLATSLNQNQQLEGDD